MTLHENSNFNPNCRAAYFPALTGLRFLLILIIVYYHGYLLFGPIEPNRLDMFFRNHGGYFGNVTFFTLSGFLISHGYANKIQHGGLSFPSFFKARMIALYPLYFITTWCGIFLAFYFGGISRISFQNVFMDLMMLSTGWFGNMTRYNSPLWFTCAIVQCYIVFYLIHYVGRKIDNFPLYGSIFFVFLDWSIIIGAWQPFYKSGSTGEGLFSFFIGCFLYYYYQHTSAKQRKFAICIGIFLLVLVAILSLFNDFLTVVGEKETLFFSVLFAPLVILMCIDCSLVERVLTIAPIAKGGRMSLSIYMWHGPLISCFYFIFYERNHFFNGFPFYVRLVIFFVILLTISITSRQLIEKRLGAYLRKRYLSYPY